MSDALYITGILVRFIHLGSACLLTGIFAFLVFVARPAIKAGGSAVLDSFRRLDERLLSLSAVVLGLTIGRGCSIWSDKHSSPERGVDRTASRSGPSVLCSATPATATSGWRDMRS